MSSSADFATGDDGNVHLPPILGSPNGTKESMSKVDATMLNSMEVRSSVDTLENVPSYRWMNMDSSKSVEDAVSWS